MLGPAASGSTLGAGYTGARSDATPVMRVRQRGQFGRCARTFVMHSRQNQWLQGVDIGWSKSSMQMEHSRSSSGGKWGPVAGGGAPGAAGAGWFFMARTCVDAVVGIRDIHTYIHHAYVYAHPTVRADSYSFNIALDTGDTSSKLCNEPCFCHACVGGMACIMWRITHAQLPNG